MFIYSYGQRDHWNRDQFILFSLFNMERCYTENILY